MKKIDLFLKAMKAESFRHPQWIRGAFGIVEEDRAKAMGNLFAYRILRTGTTCFAADPDNANELALIDDAVNGKPIFTQHEKITLTADMGIPGITQDTVTTYGCWLLNTLWLFYPFNSIFGYLNKKFSATDIERMVLPLFTNNPKEGVARDPALVYVSDYLKFAQSVRYIEQFMYLFTPAGSEKTMTCSDELPKLKRDLFAKYKDQLSDPAVLAKISTEIEAADREWLKGDVGMDTLLEKKDFAVVRRKLFGFQGGEAGFDDGNEMVAIENSLEEGWDISKFPAMNDVLRVGSFNRGFQTAMGGDGFKKLIRATSNCQITIPDCGTKLGMPVVLDEEHITNYYGLWLVTPTKPVLLTKENAQQFMNKAVIVRAPNFCKLTLTDFCETCCGMKLSANKTGLSSATSRIGNVFLGLYMHAMHGKALSVTDYDFELELI